MIEVLFSLAITLIITTSLLSIYKLIAHSYQPKVTYDDIYLASKQVSQYVMGTSYIDVGQTYTYIDLEGREMCFELDNHRLVKTPGFEILLMNIDDLLFEIENEMIYMIVTRDKQQFRFLLTYAQQKDWEDNEYEIQP